MVEGSVKGLTQPTLSTIPVAGNLEHPEKTHDFRQNFDFDFYINVLSPESQRLDREK
jgi:hypothetical protein